MALRWLLYTVIAWHSHIFGTVNSKNAVSRRYNHKWTNMTGGRKRPTKFYYGQL